MDDTIHVKIKVIKLWYLHKKTLNHKCWRCTRFTCYFQVIRYKLFVVVLGYYLGPMDHVTVYTQKGRARPL